MTAPGVYNPAQAAEHARRVVADEGRVEHDPRLVEAVARGLLALTVANTSDEWLRYRRPESWRLFVQEAIAALDARAQFERESG